MGDRLCDHVGWGRIEWNANGVEWLSCWCCGAWLPLGPANDRGVPAREMELAEAIARTWSDELADSMAAYHVEQDAYDRSIKAQRARRVRNVTRMEASALPLFALLEARP